MFVEPNNSKPSWSVRHSILVFVSASVITGCSTITSGTQQSIFIETPQVDGAECKLTDSKTGTWYLPSSPGSISVLKGDGPMNIVCKKEGYDTGTVSVDEELAGATLGNIILGGGIGFFVDAASGAAQRYPDKVTIWMKPKEWQSDAEEKAWHEAKKAYEEAEAEKLKQKQSNSQKGDG